MTMRLVPPAIASPSEDLWTASSSAGKPACWPDLYELRLVAGVATFPDVAAVGGKDAIIVAVLAGWSERWQQRITAGLAAQPESGRRRLLQLWEVLAEWFAVEDFRGSLIANAAVELRAWPEHPAHQVVAAHRAWVQRFLEQLAAAGGLADPSVAAEQLHLLVEGAIVRAVSGQRETAAASARAVAAVLLAASGG